MSPTGPNSPVQRIALHEKAGFLVIGGSVVAYRFSESTGQLNITNLDGAGIFAPLSDQAAKDALDNIHKL